MKKVREERNLKLANCYPPLPLHPELESGKVEKAPRRDEITVFVLGGTEGVFEWTEQPESLTAQDLTESCGRLNKVDLANKSVVFFIHADELLAFRRMIRTWRTRAVTAYTNMRTPWLPIEYNIGQLVEVSFGTAEKVCFILLSFFFSLSVVSHLFCHYRSVAVAFRKRTFWPASNCVIISTCAFPSTRSTRWTLSATVSLPT